jgi:transcriptional regulator with XRE-family HTH domain
MRDNPVPPLLAASLTLGELLIRHRKRHHWRNPDFAETLGIHPSLLARLLADRAPRLDARVAQAIARVLEVSLEDVVQAHDAGLELTKEDLLGDEA